MSKERITERWSKGKMEERKGCKKVDGEGKTGYT